MVSFFPSSLKNNSNEDFHASARNTPLHGHESCGLRVGIHKDLVVMKSLLEVEESRLVNLAMGEDVPATELWLTRPTLLRP